MPPVCRELDWSSVLALCVFLWFRDVHVVVARWMGCVRDGSCCYADIAVKWLLSPCHEFVMATKWEKRAKHSWQLHLTSLHFTSMYWRASENSARYHNKYVHQDLSSPEAFTLGSTILQYLSSTARLRAIQPPHSAHNFRDAIDKQAAEILCDGFK